MRTVLRAVALVLAGGVVSSALAFKEPDGFRGVPWGASESALRDKLGEASAHGDQWIGCETYPAEDRWRGDRYCTGAFPLGNVTVTARYSFRSDRFVRVALVFPSRDFDRMAAIFTERYGPPTRRDRDTAVWTGKATAVALHRYLSWCGFGLTGQAAIAALNVAASMRYA